MKTIRMGGIVCIIIGALAGSLYAYTEGPYNNFFGSNAGYSNTGYYNTFIGGYAGRSNTSANYNTFLGYMAGYSNTTGVANNFLGYWAGGYNTTGSSNNFLGYMAGRSSTGSYNNFFGNNAGYATTGSYNNFLGYYAGYANTTGHHNIYIGHYAGADNTTGYHNTYIGSNAGAINTTGYSNTYIGSSAGVTNTTGVANTFIGVGAGGSGSYNSCIGYYAGGSNAGNNNVYIGQGSAGFNWGGSNNVYVGTYAGHGAEKLYPSNSGGVFLGYEAGLNETNDNRLYIDNSETTAPLIYGEFDNNLVRINADLQVVAPTSFFRLQDKTTDAAAKYGRMVLTHYTNAEEPFYLFGAASTSTENFIAYGGGNAVGNAATAIDFFTAANNTTPYGTARLSIRGTGYIGMGNTSPSYPLHMASGARCTVGGVWTNASSRAFKENIETLATGEAQAVLAGLTPVTFAYKAAPQETHVGFIAEDVPQLVATQDRTGLSPMDIVAVLTKVVQEQQKTIDTLKSELTSLKQEVELRASVAQVESR